MSRAWSGPWASAPARGIRTRIVPPGGGGTPTESRRRVRRSTDPTAEGSCDGSRINPTVRERLRTGTSTQRVPTSPPPLGPLALRIDDVVWPSSGTIQVRGVNCFGPVSAHPFVGTGLRMMQQLLQTNRPENQGRYTAAQRRSPLIRPVREQLSV